MLGDVELIVIRRITFHSGMVLGENKRSYFSPRFVLWSIPYKLVAGDHGLEWFINRGDAVFSSCRTGFASLFSGVSFWLVSECVCVWSVCAERRGLSGIEVAQYFYSRYLGGIPSGSPVNQGGRSNFRSGSS